ncbi:MFS transporter [Actinorhabdospora filicis]|uniref:MFS transporter n=1 Tax=Actinorhabdospora filicis TaxID=1785913 RepID=A0A9W6SLJ0_9ACTN|nr:MFS transporter [Actinorhabdospora filicis]GLZ79165.1 MFS transporter [Actinorhabdospora filicis]
MAPLPRYLAAAFLARLTDDGVGIAVALLALDRTGRPGLSALVLTGFMAPHLLAGPLSGALAARTRRPRLLYCGALMGFAGSLAGLAGLVGRAPTWVVLLVAVGGGACGPMITGGLSALVAGLVAPEGQSRAYAWDAATYNASSVAAPALASGAAYLWSPATATLAMAGGAALAAVLVATLPHRVGGGGRSTAAALGAGLRALWTVRPLRAITAGTTLAYLGIGSLTFTTVLLAGRWGDPEGAGPLMTAFALGALASTLSLTRLRRTPPAMRLAGYSLLGTGAALALAAVTPSFALCVVVYALAGLANGPLLSSTFHVRAEHAPEGTRAQVFTLGAAMKISAAAAGAALAGAGAALPPPVLLLVIAGLQFGGFAVIRPTWTVRDA